MSRQPREYKPFWSSPEEEKMAIDELNAALDEQENDKDYDKKMNEWVAKLVDEIGNNENFQKMITGAFIPPVFIGDNSDMQDELAKLLEEYDKTVDAQRGGNYNSKRSIRNNNKRKNIKKTKK